MTEHATEHDVERLQARLRELEAQLAAQGGSSDGVPVSRSRRDRQWWRSVLVVVLVTLGAILAPLTVVATWSHDQVGDTDRFVETVAPLASEPAVQKAIADEITQQISSFINVQEITGEALTALSDQDFVPSRAADVLPSLAVPLTSAIENFVHSRVDRVVQSDAFEEAWVQATRQAHSQMVAVLTGDTSESVDVSDGAVKINIASFVASVKQILLDEGFGFASRIPEINATFTIFESANIGKAQKGFAVLDTAARLLPILALLLLFAGVMVARNRRKALLAVGLSVAASMVFLGLVLNLVRPLYLDAVPTDVLPADAAAVIYDQLVSFIRVSLRAVGVVFLALAAAAFWFSPTGAGAAVRTGAAAGLGRLRNRSGLNTGPVGAFLTTYRTFTRSFVVILGTLVYVGIDHPTAANAIWIIVVIVAVLVVLEFLAGSAASRDEDMDLAEGPTPA